MFYGTFELDYTKPIQTRHHDGIMRLILVNIFCEKVTEKIKKYILQGIHDNIKDLQSCSLMP